MSPLRLPPDPTSRAGLWLPLARPLWALAALALALDACSPVAAQPAAPENPPAPDSSTASVRASAPARLAQSSTQSSTPATVPDPVPSPGPLAAEAGALGVPVVGDEDGDVIGGRLGGLGAGLAPVAPGRVRVSADSISGTVTRDGSVLTIVAAPGRLIVVESGDLQAGGTRIQAQSVSLDSTPGAQSLKADGEVRVELSRPVKRREYRFRQSLRRDSKGRGASPVVGSDIGVVPRPTVDASDGAVGSNGLGRGAEYFTEVLVGRNLSFSGRTRTGTLDGAVLQLSSVDVSSSTIAIEGTGYTARDVVIRPGGLTPREREIYGPVPFSIRAREVGVVLQGGRSGAAVQRRLVVRRAGVYFKNTRVLPLPLGVLAPLAVIGPRATRETPLFRAVPDFSLNSSDRFLFTTRVSFPLTGFSTRRDSEGRLKENGVFSILNLDLGISGRLGFRGGVAVENRSPLGLFALRARRADIVTTQLTNRLQLDRAPELSYESPLVPVVRLGGGRGIGAFGQVAVGRYGERIVGTARPEVQSNRLSATVGLSTRVEERDGLYADAFATRSRYSQSSQSYDNTGFEVGYLGRILPQVRGLFSLRRVAIGGSTPFRFDTVVIPRELRATFDITATPRYLIPIDLRYDLDRDELRDTSFGLLRNYKTFAYGLVYQTARRDLRLDLRFGF